MAKKMSMLQAAAVILEEAGTPLHLKEIWNRIAQKGLVQVTGKTPDASLAALFSITSRKKGKNFPFVKTEPGTWRLRGHAEDATPDNSEDAVEDDRRVRLPVFPLYSEVRLVMDVWKGRLPRDITGFKSAVFELRGTPQEPADWSTPDEWIPQRLPADRQELAFAIWKGTQKKVNPRHIAGLGMSTPFGPTLIPSFGPTR